MVFHQQFGYEYSNKIFQLSTDCCISYILFTKRFDNLLNQLIATIIDRFSDTFQAYSEIDRTAMRTVNFKSRFIPSHSANLFVRTHSFGIDVKNNMKSRLFTAAAVVLTISIVSKIKKMGRVKAKKS